jgi:translation elongation factor EF-4
VSGKTGENVDRVLDAIIERIPSPEEHKRLNPKKFQVQE